MIILFTYWCERCVNVLCPAECPFRISWLTPLFLNSRESAVKIIFASPIVSLLLAVTRSCYANVTLCQITNDEWRVIRARTWAICSHFSIYYSYLTNNSISVWYLWSYWLRATSVLCLSDFLSSLIHQFADLSLLSHLFLQSTLIQTLYWVIHSHLCILYELFVISNREVQALQKFC